MAKQNYISVLVEMLNAAKFQRDAQKSSDAVKGIGNQADAAGKKTKNSLASLAKWAASAYIFRRAAGYLSGAVNETEDLAKASLQLQRLTGLDVKTSSEWIVVAKTRNIEANRLSIMFTQLGRTQQRALAGSKAQALAFKQVGISVGQLRDQNTTQLVESISDAFAAMPDGLQKAALAQQFFGRTGRQLLPLLNEGSASLQESLDMVQKYGAALEGKTAEDVRQMIKRQRELTIAQMGFKEQLSDALIPTLTALSANLKTVLGFLTPLLKNQTVMRVVLMSLAGAWIAYTIAQGLATIAAMEFRDVFMTTGIGLLIVGLSLLIVKWDSVRPVLMRAMPALLMAKNALMAVKDAAVSAWQWFSTNWPTIKMILIAPLLPAIVMVKTLVRIVEWAVDKIQAAYGKIGGTLGKIAGLAGRIADPLNLHSHLPGLPSFATGGRMAFAGPAVVGERGPEIVHLPTGTRVDPIEHAPLEASRGPLVVNIQPSPVVVDGKKVGQVLWKRVNDEGAWR